jgi:hypothetical protein
VINKEFRQKVSLKNDISSETAEKAIVEFASLSKRGPRRKHNSDELLTHLKEIASRLGYTPSCKEIYEKEKYTYNMYITCFGSLHNAQKLAALKPRNNYNSIKNVTRENCVEDIKRMYVELGGPPNWAQLKKYGKYPFGIYYSRLGGLKKIKKLPELKML